MANSGHLELLKSLELGRQLYDLAEILHDDTYGSTQKTAGVSLETGSRIMPPGAFFLISFLGHISAIDTVRSPVRAESPASCGHSKIACVCAYCIAHYRC